MTSSTASPPPVWNEFAAGIARRNVRRMETIADTWRAMGQHAIKISERAAGESAEMQRVLLAASERAAVDPAQGWAELIEEGRAVQGRSLDLAFDCCQESLETLTEAGRGMRWFVDVNLEAARAWVELYQSLLGAPVPVRLPEAPSPMRDGAEVTRAWADAWMAPWQAAWGVRPTLPVTVPAAPAPSPEPQ